MVGPIIFATLVSGIAHVRDLKSLGRLGLKSLIYFELLTTVALLLGYLTVQWWQPGASLQLSSLGPLSVSPTPAATSPLHLIPGSLLEPFLHMNLLQVLVLAILTGLSLSKMGNTGDTLLAGIEKIGKLLFQMLTLIMYAAPIGVAGAMWYTVGALGTNTLLSLLYLMVCVYATCGIFIAFILAGVAYFSGFNIWRFIWYIRQELMLAFATSSSETALPGLMQKLEQAGCPKNIVGLVVPTGYSFNLDGTCIYLTMGAFFLAQATQTSLSWQEEAGLIALMMLTSKGAAAVTGGGLITLSATLQSFQKIPHSGLSLLLGIDRVMSEARTVTNLIGNGVATLVIARWEKQLDLESMKRVFRNDSPSKKVE